LSVIRDKIPDLEIPTIGNGDPRYIKPITGHGPRVEDPVVHHDGSGEAELVRVVRDVHARLLLPPVVQNPRTASADTADALARSLPGHGDCAVLRRIRVLPQQFCSQLQVLLGRSRESLDLAADEVTIVDLGFPERTRFRNGDDQQQQQQQ